jgi:hypothetical protein
MATVPRPTSPLAGEVDTYHFEVASAATDIMTTEGPSDTVLTSHGSADLARSWHGTTTAAAPPTPASCESCSRASTGWPCAIRTATRLVPTLWASLLGVDDL